MSLFAHQHALLAPLKHGFFTRQGGTIQPGGELDIGFSDQPEPERAAENRQRIADWMGAPLVTAKQVHGTQVLRIDAVPYQNQRLGEADALVTRTPGVALGIITADCLPVLFADREAGVIGAAHAGWRGLVAGVLEATLESMSTLGAKQIQAVVGPGIAQASYEVGPEVIEQAGLAGQDTPLVVASGQPNRFLLDLPGLALSRLAAAGLADVQALGLDTYALETQFYSHRRDTHQGVRLRRRQMSTIRL